MAQKIQIRRGTTTEWTTKNPVLAEGELGLDLTLNDFKIGNGIDTWSNLLYSNTMNLDNLTDVTITTPELDEVLKFNGTTWVNGVISPSVSAGAGVNYFLTATVSGISTYDIMSKIPDSVAEVDENVDVNSSTGQLLLAGYISDIEIGHTKLDAGIWKFNVYNYASSASGTTYMTLKVYKRTSAGVETLLFQSNSPTIGHTTTQLQTWSTVQPEFATNTTDKIVFKFYAQTNSGSNVFVHLVHSGTSHYTYIETPLVTHHNDLAQLQGGTTDQYFHLTSSEYTGTGTGTFVKSNSPNITTPTGIVKNDVGLGNVDNTSDLNKPISTSTQTALDLKANLSSPAFTGTPTAPTAANGTSTTQIATTQFVINNLTTGGIPDATTTVKGVVKLAGDLSGTADLPTVPGLSTKEPTITTGTTTDYWRGDKTFHNLENSVRGTVLTGLSTATAVPITSSDTIISSLGKLQGQQDAKKWIVAGSTVITTAANTSSIVDIAAYDMLRITIYTSGYSGAGIVSLQFGGTAGAVDVGSNYLTRFMTSTSGNNSWTNTQNNTQVRMALSSTAVLTQRITQVNITNLSTRVKNALINTATSAGTTTTSQPFLEISAGEWINTTQQIRAIRLISSANNLTVGTGFIVEGINF